MAQHTTIDAVQQPLLSTFVQLLLPLRQCCRQERPFQRLVALALAAAVTLGRQTTTQSLATLGIASDWSAFYRLFSTPRLDAALLRQQVFRASLPLVPASGPYVVALDGVQVPRHSWRLVGTSWLYDPSSPPFQRGIRRAQRFTDLALLLPATAQGYSRAVPLWWEPAVPRKGVRRGQLPAGREWQVGMAQLQWLRATLDAAGRTAQPLLAVADSGWQGAAVWNDLPPGTTLLAGCRRNRALYALPSRHHGRGRPRRYGARAPRPDAWLAERRGWQQHTVTIRGRQIPLRYRVAGPYVVRGAPERPLFLLVVRGSTPGRGRKQRRARFWLVNAVWRDGRWRLPFPVPTLLAWAWQRWEIEVTHREMKTGFGVGQSQCWNPTSAILSVQWQVVVYSLLILAGYRCWGLRPGPPRPPGTWWRGSGRWSLDQLRQAVRREVMEAAEYRPVWSRMTANWWEMADWITLQHNALQAAGRL